jgi:hypothetical protein
MIILFECMKKLRKYIKGVILCLQKLKLFGHNASSETVQNDRVVLSARSDKDKKYRVCSELYTENYLQFHKCASIKSN